MRARSLRRCRRRTSPSGAPQFSEALARAHVQALEDIGYRIVGTPEHASGRDYVLAEARRLAALCAGVAGLECEVELQRGNGSHRSVWFPARQT